MENARNFQKELDKLLEQQEKNQENGKRLFLHSCCAPCSSYVLEYLSRYFTITIYFYNPNIMPEKEFSHRLSELRRLLQEMPLSGTVSVVAGVWEPERFLSLAKGLEQEPEWGERCRRCIGLRLEETFRAAKAAGADYVTTTLSISPHKDAQFINEKGAALAEQYGVPWLFSDFKKKGGYQRSIVLSREYDLYRQNFCGCVFSAMGIQKKTSIEI